MENSANSPVGETLPILCARCSENQRLPSAPAVMLQGPPSGVGTGNSEIVPDGVMRPIRFAPLSVNHRFPSGPAAMLDMGPTSPLCGSGYSENDPAGEILPILSSSVNHRFPSGPDAIAVGTLLSPLGTGNSVIPPAGVMEPILPRLYSVNQMLPSGP